MNVMSTIGPNPSLRPPSDASVGKARVAAVAVAASGAHAGSVAGVAAGLRTGNATAKRKSVLLHPAAKVLLFALCLLPFFWLFYGAWANTLGANPAEALIRATGDWTLRFLCITLAVTPLRTWTNLPALARFRRMLGLFTFFYVVTHFLSYGWLDQGFDIDAIVTDIIKRPFILVGTAGLLLMIPLAATSFNRAIKAMGAARWQLLHRAVYLIVLLGLLHFFWMRAAKNNFAEVAVYAVVIAVLLGWRVKRALAQRKTAARA